MAVVQQWVRVQVYIGVSYPSDQTQKEMETISPKGKGFAKDL